jgi:hypothetical protein
LLYAAYNSGVDSSVRESLNATHEALNPCAVSFVLADCRGRLAEFTDKIGGGIRPTCINFDLLTDNGSAAWAARNANPLPCNVGCRSRAGDSRNLHSDNAAGGGCDLRSQRFQGARKTFLGFRGHDRLLRVEEQLYQIRPNTLFKFGQ